MFRPPTLSVVMRLVISTAVFAGTPQLGPSQKVPVKVSNAP